MARTELKKVLEQASALAGQQITVCGWVKTIRDSKALGFIELNDGSSFSNLQVVFEDAKVPNFKEIAKCNVGTALRVTGTLTLTPNAKQPCEIHACEIVVEGVSAPDYPLQKKRHSLEYLRTIAHLRTEDGAVDYSQDFFGKMTSLTVSGQLEAECMAMAFGSVYTFGPTFRAEKSNTPRHAAEFWMIEPEIAFADLQDDMALAQDMIKYVLRYVLEQCPQEMKFFNDFYDKELISRLQNLIEADFGQITYTEAGLLGLRPANRARAVSDGEDFQKAGICHRLSERNQSVLHAFK